MTAQKTGDAVFWPRQALKTRAYRQNYFSDTSSLDEGMPFSQPLLAGEVVTVQSTSAADTDQGETSKPLNLAV